MTYTDSLESRDESPVYTEALEELLSFVLPLLQHDPDLDVPASNWSPVTSTTNTWTMCSF